MSDIKGKDVLQGAAVPQNAMDQPGMQEANYQVITPRQDTEYTKKMKEGFGVFGLASFLYAALYAFCMFRNGSGVTYPFFIAGSLLYFCFCLSKLEISLKKGSSFYMISMMLLAVSTFCTDDGRIHMLNKTGIFLLLISLLLNQMYDTTSWKLGKYLGSIVILIFGSIGELYRPFTDGSRYRKKHMKGMAGKIFYGIVGAAIACPLLLIVFVLLASADAVFWNMTSGFFENLKIGNIVQITFMVLLMFLAAYCLVSFYCKKSIKQEVTDKRRGEPILAITVTGLLSALYLLFSGIQIIYLFLGQMQLPEGYTYAAYAREGFFQLLAVSILNLIIVLAGLNYFRESKVLKLILTVMSLCTFIMIASSALRMIIYIKYYYLTFLRILVLWTLAVLFLLFTGVIIGIFRERFPLFRYSMTVVTLCYLLLSFAHPDYWIARVNVSNIESAAQDGRNRFFEGEYYNDYYYLSYLCADAAPVLIPFLGEQQGYSMDEYMEFFKADEDAAWHKGESGYGHVYLRRLKVRLKDNGWRSFNISRYMAYQAVEKVAGR